MSPPTTVKIYGVTVNRQTINQWPPTYGSWTNRGPLNVKASFRFGEHVYFLGLEYIIFTSFVSTKSYFVVGIY